VQQPGKSAYLGIVSAFGRDILNNDGTINRAALGALVFGSKSTCKAALKQLNSIVHPAIARECLTQLVYHGLCRGQSTVYDAALMAESGTWALCWPQVINIHVGPVTQIARLMQRNSMTELDARARVAVQASPENRRLIANRTVDNSCGSIEQLQHEILAVASAWL
jgi:dephospho-CoA kinase